MELFDLTGRTALITGSNKGVGFALAAAPVSSGARVRRPSSQTATNRRSLIGYGDGLMGFSGSENER